MAAMSPESDSDFLDDTFNSNKSFLEQCFGAVLKNMEINFTSVDVLEILLREEFGIIINKLDENLVKVLPDILMYFMEHWLGWKFYETYKTGKISFATYYRQFHNYLKFHLNKAITGDYQKAKNLLKLKWTPEALKVFLLSMAEENTEWRILSSIHSHEISVILNAVYSVITPAKEVMVKIYKP